MRTTPLRHACALLAWYAETLGPEYPEQPAERARHVAKMRELMVTIEAIEAGNVATVDPTGTDPFPVVAGAGAMAVAVDGAVAVRGEDG